jgi:hypothetical protein
MTLFAETTIATRALARVDANRIAESLARPGVTPKLARRGAHRGVPQA